MAVLIKKLWLWCLLFSYCLASWTEYIDDYDSIKVVHCDVKCNRYSPMAECMDICLAANNTKPGKCPETNSISPFEAACLVACNTDSQCSDVTKCCKNSCGITCMQPTDLEKRNDLPPIPDNIEIRREKSNIITLYWSIWTNLELEKIMKKDWIQYKQSVRYLVEERHVLGPRYLESRLSPWSVCQVTNKNHMSIQSGIKSGHWYQFRVAAVNEIGSRGYSMPSILFKTAEPKNPRQPRSLSLSKAHIHGDGKLGILIHWRQPPSDIPITFYKLFWSKLIHGPTNDSILVYHRSVPKDKNCFEVSNLDIGNQYFLQVQAISIYGGRRLASHKASKVFNSTDFLQYDNRSATCARHDSGLRVHRFVCQCGETIEARLVWPDDPYATGYNVSWRENTCLHDNKNSNIIYKFGSISPAFQLTQITRLDIKQLRKNCTYSVNVRSINGDKKRNHSHNNIKLNHDYSHGERNLGLEFVTYGCKHNPSHDNNERVRELDIHRCRKRKARIKRLEDPFLL